MHTNAREKTLRRNGVKEKLNTTVRYKESLREKSHKSSQILHIWMRFWVILNRLVGFGYAELKVLPRKGTIKEHILLYRTHVNKETMMKTPILSRTFDTPKNSLRTDSMDEPSLWFKRGLVWTTTRARCFDNEGSLCLLSPNEKKNGSLTWCKWAVTWFLWLCMVVAWCVA